MRGASWFDSFAALIGPRGEGVDVDRVLTTRRLLRDVDAEAFDINLALYVGYFFTQCHPAGAADVAPHPRPPALAGRGLLGVARRAPGLAVSGPRAAGVRTPYAEVPADVRAWVDATLGSPVVEAHEQVGGMSPGCATRVVCADGTRAFVKAVGADLNPDTPNLFRREVAVLELLGSHDLWADLLASRDDGDWVALLLEDVEGTHPDFHDDADLDAVLATTDRLAEVLGERVPDPGVWTSPVPLVSVNDRFAIWAETLATLDSAPEIAPVPVWLRADADRWAAALTDLAAEPHRQLVHWDIRNDNLLRRPGGEIVVVDWGMAAIGPEWADPLLARLERVDEAWFDSSIASSPAIVTAGDEAITAWLIGFATHLAVRSVTAVDVNLPTLNDFRRRESARMFVAAGRRTLSER